MEKKIFFVLLLFLFMGYTLFFAGCNDKITNPPEENPPGYQKDIPWPSLADSPWPMYRCDPQNTGRSRYKGAISGNLEWSIDTIFNKSGITVGSDSAIYFINSSGISSGLYAVNQNGYLKWFFPFQSNYTSYPQAPIIGVNGTIYTASQDEAKFYAINSDGTLKWIIDSIFTLCTGNTIGKDGTLYIYSSEAGGKIYAVSEKGNIIWQINIESTYGESSSLALSPDSRTLYIVGTPGHFLAAIDLTDVRIKWKIMGKIRNNPTVDSEGNIYFAALDSLGYITIYSVNEDGTARWFYKSEENDAGDIAIDRKGNIYFNFSSLYSIDYGGKLRWKKSLPGVSHSAVPIVIDKDGNIFLFQMINGKPIGMCYDDSGRLLWNSIMQNGNTLFYSPAITFNGIIVPTFRDKYIFKLN